MPLSCSWAIQSNVAAPPHAPPHSLCAPRLHVAPVLLTIMAQEPENCMHTSLSVVSAKALLCIIVSPRALLPAVASTLFKTGVLQVSAPKQLAHLVGLSCIVQDALCAGGLAGIDVGTDSDVPVPVQGHDAPTYTSIEKMSETCIFSQSIMDYSDLSSLHQRLRGKAVLEVYGRRGLLASASATAAVLTDVRLHCTLFPLSGVPCQECHRLSFPISGAVAGLSTFSDAHCQAQTRNPLPGCLTFRFTRLYELGPQFLSQTFQGRKTTPDVDKKNLALETHQQ